MDMGPAHDLRLAPEHGRASPEPVEAEGDWVGWVEAALGGDRGGMARLYDRFVPVVRSMALARLPGHLADDLVHDVFVAVLGKLDTLREPRAFPGWLMTLTRNRITDAQRRRARSELRAEPAEPAMDASPEAKEVLRLVRSLPEAYAETLCMRLVEGLTGPEIALRTGLTEGSVRVNLHRGMKLLRQKLEQGGHHGR